ncbi:MAG TPA: S24 family peptidase [Rhodothermales bacterium]|nr:S24 family peptidase [Rhodothermales bacterium]
MSLRFDDPAIPALDLNAMCAFGGRSLLVRLSTDAMSGAGLREGDLLVVDGDAPVRPGCVVLAMQHSDYICARFVVHEGRPCLAFEKARGQERVSLDGLDAIAGVVTWAIRRMDTQVGARLLPR